MKDKHERLLDEYLRIATDSYLEEIEKENEKTIDKYSYIEFPEELDTWFEEKMDKKRKTELRLVRVNKYKYFAKRTAAVFFAIIIIGSVLGFSVEAIRVEIMNLFISESEEYNELSFDSSNTLLDIGNEYELLYYPKVMPEGHTLESFEASNVLYNYKFLSHDKKIVLNIHTEATDLRIDNENGDVEDIVISGHKGKIQETNSFIFIVIELDDYVISVKSDEEKEILIKLLENTI